MRHRRDMISPARLSSGMWPLNSATPAARRALTAGDGFEALAFKLLPGEIGGFCV